MADDGNGITVRYKLLALLGSTIIAIIGWTISIEVQRREDTKDIAELQVKVAAMFDQGTKANQILRQRVDQNEKAIEAHRGFIATCFQDLSTANQRLVADEVDTKRVIERVDKLS